jgi:uncharacterized OsmC-like protein
MSETRDYKVSLRFVRGYEFVATFPDAEALPPIVFDEPPPLGEGSGPNAAAVLAAAIGNCLAASFAFCLRKVRLEPVDVTADVVAHVARNEQGRYRIKGIDVELAPDVLEQDRPFRGVVLADLHAKRILSIDDYRELRVVECLCRQRQRCADKQDEPKNCAYRDHLAFTTVHRPY